MLYRQNSNPPDPWPAPFPLVPYPLSDRREAKMRKKKEKPIPPTGIQSRQLGCRMYISRWVESCLCALELFSCSPGKEIWFKAITTRGIKQLISLLLWCFIQLALKHYFALFYLHALSIPVWENHSLHRGSEYYFSKQFCVLDWLLPVSRKHETSPGI